MSDNYINIKSYKGAYKVSFYHDIGIDAFNDYLENTCFIVDKQVAEIYSKKLKIILDLPSTLIIEATEENKSLHNFEKYICHLVKHQIRRNYKLVAIGGGIIQDITCFIASTFLRGLDWHFFPTTLLAQADSCIGSKSSINCKDIKNILGTFLPPKQINIYSEFLGSLSNEDMKSGVGEIIKVHAINSKESLTKVISDYSKLFTDYHILSHYIKKSLEYKKILIEIDEFDKNERNVMNYGHTFGHAIESATNFAIPHGVAVSIGMDIANYMSQELECNTDYFPLMHDILSQNFAEFKSVKIPKPEFYSALSKDKKNVSNTHVTAIIPDVKGVITKKSIEITDENKNKINSYFDKWYVQ